MTKFFKNYDIQNVLTRKEIEAGNKREARKSAALKGSMVAAPIIAGVVYYSNTTNSVDDNNVEEPKVEETSSVSEEKVVTLFEGKVLSSLSPEHVKDVVVENGNVKYTLNTDKAPVHAPINGKIKGSNLSSDELDLNLKGIEIKEGISDVKAGDIIGFTNGEVVDIEVDSKVGEIKSLELDDNFNYSFKQHKELKPNVISTSEDAKEILDSVDSDKVESVVMKEVKLENKNQASLLQSTDVYYIEDKLTLDTLKNGKANVHPANRELEPLVRNAFKTHNLDESLVEAFMAILQKENGGDKHLINTDPAQSSQSKNGIIGSIANQQESINQGVKHFKESLEANNMFKEESEQNDVRFAIQTYNFGLGLGRDSLNANTHYSVKFVQDMAKKYYDNTDKTKLYKMGNREWRGEARYGDFTYVSKYFNIFEPAEVHSVPHLEDVEIQLVEVEETLETKNEEESIKDKIEDAVSLVDTVSANEKVNNESTDVVESSDSIERLLNTGRKFSPYFKGNLDKDRQAIIEMDKLYSKPIVSLNKGNKSLDGVKVFLDAGHGGQPGKNYVCSVPGGKTAGDVGAVAGNGMRESEIVFDIYQKTKASLESLGAEVVSSRSDDRYVCLEDRVKLANESGSDLFLSIHANSADKYSARGFEVLYNTRDERSLNMAKVMDNHSAKALPKLQHRNLNPRNSSNLYIMRANMPVVLFEAGFVNNPHDLATITNPKAQISIANSLANSVLDVYGKEEIKKEVVEEEVVEEVLDDVNIEVNEKVEDSKDESDKDLEESSDDNNEEIEEDENEEQEENEEIKEDEDEE